MMALLPTKADTVFQALMTGRSFNLFEAQLFLHDRCLHSTVAQLQKVKGITIERKRETVAGYQGIPTSVCRYWIAPEEMRRIINSQTSQLPNKKAFAPTRQDKDKCLNLNTCDDTEILKKSQDEPKNRA
jgi:uncharacterized membrane protein YbaN (DUF454 family)